MLWYSPANAHEGTPLQAQPQLTISTNSEAENSSSRFGSWLGPSSEIPQGAAWHAVAQQSAAAASLAFEIRPARSAHHRLRRCCRAPLEAAREVGSPALLLHVLFSPPSAAGHAKAPTK